MTGGSSVAIDSVFTTTDFTRIHADISFVNGVGVDALLDFIYQPIEGESYMGMSVQDLMNLAVNP